MASRTLACVCNATRGRSRPSKPGASTPSPFSDEMWSAPRSDSASARDNTIQCREPGPSWCECNCSSTSGTTGDSGSLNRSAPTRQDTFSSASDAASATSATVCKSTARPNAASSPAVSRPSEAESKNPKAART
eukprot:scaffold4277_cov24-Tisochrysis_lutea.AAC.1